MDLSRFLRIVCIIFPLLCFTIHAKCNHNKTSYLLGINLNVNSPVVICDSLDYHSIPRRSRNEIQSIKEDNRLVDKSLFPFAYYISSLDGTSTQVSSIIIDSPSIPRKDIPNAIRSIVNQTLEVNYFNVKFDFAYPETPYKGNAGFVYYTLPEAVKKYSFYNSVLLMLTDSGYLNQFWNTYVVNNLESYRNLVVACLDRNVYEILYDRGVQVAFIDVSVDTRRISTNSFSDQNSPLFKQKLQWKLNVLLATLQCNVSLLYMDADIVLFKNPFPYFYSLKDIDFVAQKDWTVCTGFMFMLPTQASLHLIDVARRIRGMVNEDDQGAVITALRYVKGVRYKLLPKKLFMSGEVFFGGHEYSWDPISPSIYMFHNNFIRGKAYKDYRSKEMGRYILDVDGEYSSTSNKYFTVYELRGSRHMNLVDRRVENMMRDLVKLANRLNRTLVIPPISCYRTGVRYCNMCHFDYGRCFSKIMKDLRYPFKESVFFTNPKVPSVYKESYLYGNVYDFSSECVKRNVVSGFPPLKNATNHVVCVPCSGSIQNCIIEQLRNNNEPVLRVFSILYVCY